MPSSHTGRIVEGSDSGVWLERSLAFPLPFLLPLSCPRVIAQAFHPPSPPGGHATSLLSPAAREGQLLGLKVSDRACLAPSGPHVCSVYWIWALNWGGRRGSGETGSGYHFLSSPLDSQPCKEGEGPVLWHRTVQFLGSPISEKHSSQVFPLLSHHDTSHQHRRLPRPNVWGSSHTHQVAGTSWVSSHSAPTLSTWKERLIPQVEGSVG